MLEAYTTLGFVAAQTSAIRLGTMVTAATFRPPRLLIKAVTTLDVLSGGRAWLGIGAGYHEDEAEAMDLPLPPVAERFERLEETLRLAGHMWAGDAAPFDGRHVRPRRPVGNPLPLTRPHPPILIGGMGERKTLRLVAAVRRRLQPVRHPGRRRDDPPQARRARRATATRRPAVRGDREDGQHAARARGVGRAVRRPLRGARGDSASTTPS